MNDNVKCYLNKGNSVTPFKIMAFKNKIKKTNNAIQRNEKTNQLRFSNLKTKCMLANAIIY